MEVVSLVAAVVAAIAALVTVIFARATVQEAREARTENHAAHLEELAEMRAATESSALQHQSEMDERKRAYEAEVALRRLDQLEEVCGLLLHLAETARNEFFDPPAPVHLHGAGSAASTTLVPAVRARLRAAVAVLTELGGPDLSERLPHPGRGSQSDSMRVWQDAISLLAWSSCASALPTG